jgi:hypothetical protein
VLRAWWNFYGGRIGGRLSSFFVDLSVPVFVSFFFLSLCFWDWLCDEMAMPIWEEPNTGFGVDIDPNNNNDISISTATLSSPNPHPNPISLFLSG